MREPGAAGRVDRDEGGGLLLAEHDEADVGELADVVRARRLADADLLGQLPHGNRSARRSRRRAAAAPGSDRPGRRTTRRRSRRPAATAGRTRSRGAGARGQVDAHAASIDVRRWLRQSTTRRYSRCRSIDAHRWRSTRMNERPAGRGDRCGAERVGRGGASAGSRAGAGGGGGRAVGGDVGARVASRAAVLPVGGAGRLRRGEAAGADGLGRRRTRTGTRPGAEWARASTCSRWPTRWVTGCATAPGWSGVARRGRDLVVDAGRETEPLTVHVVTSAGEERITARAVVDASGTWTPTQPAGRRRVAGAR